MTEVKSPYNFVPAPTEEQVYKPDWAAQVSHDIPFSDGESGEISLTITAQTPIFIRNGHSKQEVELFDKWRDGKLPNPSNEQKQAIERYLSFSNIDGNYFIPATSLKGMFRSVLEIMSFSRLNKKLVNDHRYSFRDLSDSNNLYMTNYKENEIRGGWLIEDSNGNWKIEECEELGFIHHAELQKKGINFRDLFLNNDPIDKTASFKYKQLIPNLLNGKFETYTKELFGNVTRNMAKYSSNGKHGTLVFTGQSSRRTEPADPSLKASGKVHEFVFIDKNEPTYIDISKEMQKDFLFIYLDHDSNSISKDWIFWKNEYLAKNKKVPVFYSKDKTNKLNHFGLAYMYKLPFKNKVTEMLPISEYKNTLDLASILFGNSDKESLKGRVIIAHAKCTNAIVSNKVEREILGSPKASYFPFYCQQFKKEGVRRNKHGKEESFKEYFTFDDKKGVLSGYKRYLIQDRRLGTYDEKQKRNEKVFTSFIPLKENSVFETKIRFHNLKPEELGALLSAITFHGNNDKCFHNIGMAKPLGYGKIKVEVTAMKLMSRNNQPIQDFMVLFKEDIQKTIKKKQPNFDWWQSPQIKELFLMASNTITTNLTYPDTIKDFVNYKSKKNPQKLEYFSSFDAELHKRDFNKEFKPAKKKQLQSSLELESFQNIVDLSKFLREQKTEIGDDYNKSNLDKIIAKIKELHSERESKKKMKKLTYWENNLFQIVGKEKGEELIQELGIIFE